ncbi:MAG: GNAT family N-acetyltransferase [Actinomycetales bacterium]|nr:GNAT family N-acetyltransferase [Actinomycetales bacterium]
MPALVAPFLPAGSLSARPQPRLSGRGLSLRPWADEDIEGLVTAYTDPDIQRWHHCSLDAEEAAELILHWRKAWDTEGGASWAVVDADDSLLGRVGFCGLRLSEGVAEISYWVLPDARRRGVATSAVTSLARWAFDTIGLQRLEIRHSVANVASCAVAVATGFSEDTREHTGRVVPDGSRDPPPGVR